MEVYSIVNLKGGVGKTVTACNLAAILGAWHEKRVLLIDADAQANTTAFYSCDRAGSTLADVLAGRCNYWPEFILETEVTGVSILPADISLLEQDIASVRRGGMESIKFLGDLIQVLAEDDAFDIVLFDCPPAFSAASVAAIAVSDAVIIPTKLDAWSLSGVVEIARQIEAIRKEVKPGIRVAGVLITMYHRSDVQVQGAEYLRAILREQKADVYDTVIRRTDKVDEATFARQPIYQWSRTSSAGRDYLAWVEEFLRKEAQYHG